MPPNGAENGLYFWGLLLGSTFNFLGPFLRLFLGSTFNGLYFQMGSTFKDGVVLFLI